MKNKRLEYVDIARGIAIILIVLGHSITYSQNCRIIYKIIYSFHVALFFIISGYTYKIKKEESFFEFFKRKFIRIMVPYYIWALLFIIPFYIFGSSTGDAIGASYSMHGLKKIFFNILYANGNLFALKQNSALWFLPSLFSMEIIYYYVIKKSDNNKFLTALYVTLEFIIAIMAYKFMKFVFPLGINTCLHFGIFYHLGYLIKKNNLIESNILNNIFSFIIITIIGIFSALLNHRIVSAIDYAYGNLYLAIFSGIFLSISVFIISKKIKTNKLLEYIGQNTMGILIFHKLAVVIMQSKLGIISNLLKKSNICIEIIIGLSVTSIAILFSLIINKIVKIVCPIMIGKKNKKAS
mgnify:CR=1 FL=1